MIDRAHASEWYLSEKLTPEHLERLAVVYVRQSTLQQVMDHQESTRIQYGLANRAAAWGWSTDRIVVIDEDQVVVIYLLLSFLAMISMLLLSGS